MNAWVHVLRLELRRVARERSLLWLMLLYMLIAGYAAWTGGAWADARREAQAFIAEETAGARNRTVARATETMEQNPQSGFAATLPFGVLYSPMLPVQPLAPLSLGQGDAFPYVATFHALRSAQGMFDRHSLGITLENPQVLSAGRFDLAFVIVFLFPLFLLAGTYDIWTQERDLGTAGFILSQPRPPVAILAAKLLARGGWLLIALILIPLLALLAVTAGQPFDARGFAHAVLVMGLYGTFWLLVAVAVNVRARHSAQAAIACGGIWLALLFFVPAMLSATANLVRPPPSQAGLVNDLRTIELDILHGRRQQQTTESSDRTTSASSNTLLNTYRSHLARIESEDSIYAEVVEPFRGQQVAHLQVGNNLRVLSPAVTVQHALERIAGNEGNRAISFQRQAQEFLESQRHFASTYRIENPAWTASDHYRNMPEFSFRESTGTDRHMPFLVDLATLLLFNLITAVIAFSTVRRQPLFTDDSGEKH